MNKDVEEVLEISKSRFNKELMEAKHEKANDLERLEYEKKNFAEELKNTLGAEIKEVLTESAIKSAEPPKEKKESKLRKILNKLATICQ